MSNTTRNILMITMVMAMIIAVVIGAFTWWKMNQIRKKAIKQNFTDSYQNVWKNNQVGELLWELKKQTNNPLEDEQLIYAINTIYRNGYETSCVLKFDSDYEIQNLRQIGQQNINCNFFEFLLINLNEKIIDDLTINLSSLNQKGIIIIANAVRKGKIYDKISSFCNEYKLRFNYEWVGKGIIIIAK